MKTRGFTLIELLVVIAIIGILSSVVLVSLSTARAKANDSRRLSDMKELRSALELYYTDNNAYPSTSASWWGNCPSFGSKGTSGATGWVPNLAPTYIPQLPLDPKPVGTSGCYLY
ncbi:prepilin-type N-terminal cleavage/methylation domain-containing protein, partial [Patescibacteria group bacterium]|nr:prepilin-type N-terminal cleavage/methylation domain-containing protein [Patescibacteria group bacterium]MBU1755170.1 prepilin-type N-terminal cleavage/methylation domain-containing protein [Patescibacteria group bacterium]